MLLCCFRFYLDAQNQEGNDSCLKHILYQLSLYIYLKIIYKFINKKRHQKACRYITPRLRVRARVDIAQPQSLGANAQFL